MSNKPYIRKKSNTWFLEKPFYLAYALREATAIAMLIYCINLVDGLFSLSLGKESWNSWVSAQGTFLIFTVSAATLASSLYHSYTWFVATPKIVAIQKKDGKKIPERVIVLTNWIALGVITVIFLIFAWGVGHG